MADPGFRVDPGALGNRRRSEAAQALSTSGCAARGGVEIHTGLGTTSRTGSVSLMLSVLGASDGRSAAELDPLLWCTGHRIADGELARLAAAGSVELRYDPTSGSL